MLYLLSTQWTADHFILPADIFYGNVIFLSTIIYNLRCKKSSIPMHLGIFFIDSLILCFNIQLFGIKMSYKIILKFPFKWINIYMNIRKNYLHLDPSPTYTTYSFRFLDWKQTVPIQSGFWIFKNSSASAFG